MASELSYKITISNNLTEKEGIKILKENDKSVFEVDSEVKKEILRYFGLDNKYIRSFDLIRLKNYKTLNAINNEIIIENLENIELIELKTTKKKLKNFPRGFFFGATQNEFDIANLLGDTYKFCFISLSCNSFQYMSLLELERIIKNKRIQYQINL